MQLNLLAANVLFWVPFWKHYTSSGAICVQSHSSHLALPTTACVEVKPYACDGPDVPVRVQQRIQCSARRPAGGATPATSERAHALLSQGHSLCIHVGGIAEMFEGHEAKEVVHLSRRRGFLRFALCHGAPVVPMYHFGGSQIFSFWPRCATLRR